MKTKAITILLVAIWIAIGAVAFGATPDIQFQAPSGIALDLRLCPLASDTATETVDATEQTNALGWFVAACGDGRTGTFRCSILLDSDNTVCIGSFVCTVANDENTYRPEHIPDSITAQAVAADTIDEVWDEDIVAAHGTADTAGYLLSILTGRSGVTPSSDVDIGSLFGWIMGLSGGWNYDRDTDSLEAIGTKTGF